MNDKEQEQEAERRNFTVSLIGLWSRDRQVCGGESLLHLNLKRSHLFVSSLLYKKLIDF